MIILAKWALGVRYNHTHRYITYPYVLLCYTYFSQQFDEIDVQQVLWLQRPSHRDMSMILHTVIDNNI